ncbi:hypothetical protein HanIR_Chr05g0234991 [Helianthus annuus]|nr:hypothetical protein HanIR_Chr05g0234991 [Helianthus annuus]
MIPSRVCRMFQRMLVWRPQRLVVMVVLRLRSPRKPRRSKLKVLVSPSLLPSDDYS